jgi:hypothetical protein
MTTGDGSHPHRGGMFARLESTLPHKKICTPICHPLALVPSKAPGQGGNARTGENLLPNISPMAFGSGLMQLNSVLSGQYLADNALIGGPP